ncbi:MAG TPA: transglutaminase-like cysteine peptidase [Hyphomicrobiaceae bacterium]|jgi:predicted transglutaminase-like cysteine proteinase|nr:transglutaminase-like cysteine peptidase [Hyphomicrobiaceae bacterium]
MRTQGILAAACIAGALMAGAGAQADPANPHRERERASPFLHVYGVAQPPYGFVQFCERMSRECRPSAVMDEQRFTASPERMREIDAINRKVNRDIEPATDMEIYGVAEYWTIPTMRGDCEDYALLKRKLLMARGWPASALLMTVVRDEKGEGHAVLTVRTVQGDFILDNKNNDVKLWSQTGYQYVMRQSYLDPRIWMSLDPTDGGSTLPIAGVRPR